VNLASGTVALATRLASRFVRASYTLAGHPLPLVARDGDVIELPGEGLLLGVSTDATYAEYQFRFERGDALVLYTDGVIEALDPRGEMFGEGRLEEAVRENATLGARALAKAIHSRVIEHTAGEDLSDDFTVTVTKIA